MPTTSLRHLSVTLTSEEKRVKDFSQRQWRIASLAPGEPGQQTLGLQLYLTERAAYRFNLTSGDPRLFVRCGFPGAPPVPSAITASQDVAAAWLDGEQQVLEAPMPLAIQVWLEAYLARHGEAPAEGRKRQRQGSGRAREARP